MTQFGDILHVISTWQQLKCLKLQLLLSDMKDTDNELQYDKLRWRFPMLKKWLARIYRDLYLVVTFGKKKNLKVKTLSFFF